MLFEHGTTDDRLTIERLDADRFRALEDAFLILAQRLRQKGIHLIVVGYPDKSMLYPERLPAQAPTIARGGNYDTLRQFLAGQSALTFIDAEVILNREKSQTDEPLFYKTDIHDNLVGQIPVVKAIVDKIAQIEGRTNIKWHEQLDLKRVDWGMGSEGRFLSLLSPVHERITYAAAGHAIGQTVPTDIGTYRIRARWTGLATAMDCHSTSNSILRRSFATSGCPAWSCLATRSAIRTGLLGLYRYFCFIRRVANANRPVARIC